MILEYGVSKAVEEGLIPIEKYKQTKQSVDLFRIDTQPLAQAEGLRGHWYHGAPGTGKSRRLEKRTPTSTSRLRTSGGMAT